uniref:Uncharacterized protein n=1 Tax=viral metagenome TaxID=1070528 RepID=A0A6C0BJW8_9ZZZZ
MAYLVNLTHFLQSKIQAMTTPTGAHLHLYLMYYHDRDPVRQAEIDFCLQMNLSNPIFSQIDILNESDDQLVVNDPRVTVKHSSRLTFNGFFKYINSRTTDPETINILINTDIVIGDQFDRITIGPNQVICLSRYELNPNGEPSVSVGGGSHDCWIWKGTIRDNLGRFYMGKFLCDGVLAHELRSCGYVLKNPMLDLKIYHVHISGIRNYSEGDKILGHRCGIKFSHNDGWYNKMDTYNDGCNIW